MKKDSKTFRFLSKHLFTIVSLYFFYYFIQSSILIALSFFNIGPYAKINLQENVPILLQFLLQNLLYLASGIGLIKKQPWGIWLGVTLIFVSIFSIFGVPLIASIAVVPVTDRLWGTFLFLLLVAILFMAWRKFRTSAS